MNFDFSNPAVLVGIAVVVLLIAVGIILVVNHKRKKSEVLKSRFGAEYEVSLHETGSRKRAEEALHSRISRIEHLKIRDLTVAERDRFLSEWEIVQSRFIDHPRGAVTEADELVNSLLVARGYPVGAFDQRAADISVNHATLVGPYRDANSIALRATRNEATTEELRSAIIQYRTLFDALLGANSQIDQRKLA
jgi:hypothetical protein